jgi:YHS domain-containing protein
MPSVAPLVERLAAEVAAATERVHALQLEAARVFLGQEQRFMRFLALTERIHGILQPRIEAFTKVNVFKDIEQNVSLELRGPEGRGFHGRTTTLSVPSSDACSGKVELSFRLGHDGPIENVIMDYRLEILPIFIKFDSHDQLVIPIDNPSEDAIAAWIDDKLVGFTRTYFEMYFTEQYQKQSFEMDPVMNIRFPRAFAAGKKEYQGHTYHFYTKESLQAFEKAPSEYVETCVVTTAVCLNARNGEADNDPLGGGGR